MAEILLSLTIIGVVAAITLPSLTGNINERTWNTQRKALYARMSQAISLMPALNGYGTLTAEQKDASGSITQSAVDTATETFITDGLSKVLKINNICDSEHLADCGLPDKILPIGNSSPLKLNELKTIQDFNIRFIPEYGMPLNTKAAAFETINGESILTYYNPNCRIFTEDISQYTQQLMCANFVYDLNGKKGPNMMGKDIGFISVLYATDSNVVAPNIPPRPIRVAGIHSDGERECRKADPESRMPNRDELTSMFYNMKLLDIQNESYWASTLIKGGANGTAWRQSFNHGDRYPNSTQTLLPIHCIKH